MSVTTESGLITKQLIFKNEVKGTSKKGKPFRIIELHDPKSLENTKFFLPQDSSVNSDGLKFMDNVLASFSAEILYGKMEFVLDRLTIFK